MKPLKAIYDFIADVWETIMDIAYEIEWREVVFCIAIGIAAGCFTYVGIALADGETSKNNVNTTKINDSAQKTDVETTVTAPEGAQAVEKEKTDVTSSSTPNQRVETPQPAVSEPTEQSGGHIPFTQAPVVAGQPETYVNTVGQCPFYEMVTEKGCVPPSYLECNADWSVCTMKGESNEQ